jgi:hypothetical protein
MTFSSSMSSRDRVLATLTLSDAAGEAGAAGAAASAGSAAIVAKARRPVVRSESIKVDVHLPLPAAR